MRGRFPVSGHATARFAATLLVVFLLAGCWNDLSRPGIDVLVEIAYNQDEILIPFFAWGDRNPARVRWRFDRFDPGTGWITYDERETQTPNGYGGILSLGNPGDGRYRLEATLLATRDRSNVPVPHRTISREFWVDRTAAVFGDRWLVSSPEDVDGNTLTPPYGAAVAGFVELTIVNEPDPDFEAPEVLLMVRAVSGDPDRPIRPPVPGQDEFDPTEHGNRIRLWDAGEFTEPKTVTIIMVVVDAAGNRSDTFFEWYEVTP